MLKKESHDCDENKEESSYHQDKVEEDSGRGSFEDIYSAIAPCIGKTPTEDTRVLDVQDEAEFDNISEKGADNGEDSCSGTLWMISDCAVVILEAVVLV